MTDQERRPRPRAVRLDGDKVVPPRSAPQPPQGFTAEVVEPGIDPFAAAEPLLDAGESAVEAAQSVGVLQRFIMSWSGVFWSALGVLLSLAFTMWVTALVENLFAHSALLGTIGLVLAGALGVAGLFLVGREFAALMRQNRIARLHIALAQARGEDDGAAARARLKELCRLYESRTETATARARILHLSREIIDGRDLIDLAERTLVLPLDERVRREIAAASKRVSVVTAVSPRAILDVIFVAGQAIWLMRRVAEIYGGRPGLLGFFKLARSVGSHLAITGGLAVGDSILQQLVGHGIAAKLSARLGEGVLNGLLTARVGLSAMAVCRPMPFGAEKQPGVADVAPFLFGDKAKS